MTRNKKKATGSIVKADRAAWKSHVATEHQVLSDAGSRAVIMILQSIENGHNQKHLEEAHKANVASFADGWLPSFGVIRKGNAFRLSQENDDSPVILEGRLMNNTWRPVLPYEQYHSVAQRVEADGNDGEGYTDIDKLLEAVEKNYMVHKTSFRLLKREDLEPVPHPQAKPTATTTTAATTTSQGAPTITPTKKQKQSPVMTSREKKNKKFCAASARPCRDQQSLQETHEHNHKMSVQQAEMAALEGEDEEKVNETDQRAHSCRDSAGQQSLQEATDCETNERNQEMSIQQVETTASKEEDEEKSIETYQGARPSRDSADQQSMQETTIEHNQEMFIQQVESTVLKEEDKENGIETDQDREEEIAMWLITVIGYNPSTKLMREYAKQFMNLGLHSSQMINDLLPANRVSTFEWMKEYHRVQFLSNANLKI
jgi:hypothetical protein